MVVTRDPERYAAIAELYAHLAVAWRQALAKGTPDQLEFLRDLLATMRALTTAEMARLRSAGG